MEKKIIKAGTPITWKDPETGKDITGPLGCDMAVYSFKYYNPKDKVNVDESTSVPAGSSCETLIDGIMTTFKDIANVAKNAPFVCYASGTDLDEKAWLHGLIREAGEDDDHLRERIKALMFREVT